MINPENDLADRLNNKSAVILLAMCYTEIKSKQGSK